MVYTLCIVRTPKSSEEIVVVAKEGNEGIERSSTDGVDRTAFGTPECYLVRLVTWELAVLGDSGIRKSLRIDFT